MGRQSFRFSKEDFNFVKEGGNIIAKWWPDRLNLKILQKNNPYLVPYDSNFSYKEEFSKLDYFALKEDLRKLMRESQEWWPADYGHYGPFFIRLAWHSAGTYRLIDGKGGASGGNQRLAPENSWPDNANLDKARRLLWPIKKKYGNKISWADLFILAGNVALEDMGFKTLGFGAGREDNWEADIGTYWGPETEWLADMRRTEDRKIKGPLAAVQMGLIYVNPEGPDGEPNVLAAAQDIRESFRKMGMTDEETVALIAGGHTFGKCHGAADPSKYLGPEPEAAPIEEQGLGWKNGYKTGKGPDTITSGLEGAWTPTPIKWDNSFLRVLFKYEWNLEKSPAGAWQWVAINPDEEDMVPDAHIKGKKHAPIMLTTDLALKMDPEFAKISKRFLENPELLEEAFAKAWFKLTHRDLGPKSRYLGPEIPEEDFVWQDPVPPIDYQLIDEEDIENLKKEILSCGLTVSELIYTAWSLASTYRDSDKRGGINGGRIAFKPLIDWEIHSTYVPEVIDTLKRIREEFNSSQEGNKKVSLADLIVLGGVAALEKSIKDAGYNIKVPFRPGRNDTTQEMIDTIAYTVMEPEADGFRNYLKEGSDLAEVEEYVLVDKASMLKLTVPEMTVLIGGLRVLGANYGGTNYGVFTDRVGVLTNDFFVNLLDMGIEWKPDKINGRDIFRGYDRKTGDELYVGTRVDLIFGSNSELRAQAEFYAQDDNREKFVKDFVKTWTKVMELDLV
ncbi:catalase/peroxidase HPI [Desulfurobacterium indicum]|uniref:Catalase-peroxidase n=1 Tax=Desulfurobacterium indicum TaxID=1914305 RepID=A0A1R1MMY7_9BACT|nr:catalase/peroxidase HPI [Desulfurobacterium indicum]OMH41080.1 catalase/peroxidase HPI [Desulfurobacterium indicum]